LFEGEGEPLALELRHRCQRLAGAPERMLLQRKRHVGSPDLHVHLLLFLLLLLLPLGRIANVANTAISISDAFLLLPALLHHLLLLHPLLGPLAELLPSLRLGRRRLHHLLLVVIGGSGGVVAHDLRPLDERAQVLTAPLQLLRRRLLSRPSHRAMLRPPRLRRWSIPRGHKNDEEIDRSKTVGAALAGDAVSGVPPPSRLPSSVLWPRTWN
ncbi:unnamed protein product, partial [Musa acuminata subsp. burmannicoides]